MLAYRSNRQPRATVPFLAALSAEAARLAAGTPGPDAVRDLVVAFDAFESAVLEACHPEADGSDPLAKALGRAALTLADAFLASLAPRPAAAAAGLGALAADLAALRQLPLPATVAAAEAEGYAWYSLYPEAYAAATRRFLTEMRPRAAVCIGIRQIGCSLSALAAAALRKAGCPVFRCTVRPRGHPFARTFHPAAALAAQLRRHAATAHYLLIDEGPGLSGSSLCCVAEALSTMGISDDRILFFPSHDPDAARFRSPVARRRWPRHRKFVGAFDPLPPLAGAEGKEIHDIGGGDWRRLLLPTAAWPPVQPQHERRKFLLFSPSAHRGPPTPDIILAKFTGFGGIGRKAEERGRQLAAAGFTPPVLERRAGFLLSRFLPGRPLAASDFGPPLLERIAAYLATLRRDFPAAAGTAAADLFAMVRHNVAVGLGDAAAARLPDLAALYLETPATAVDGRMLPHEWLQTATGFVKTDALDHHADHFYPGTTDIAWDLAATEIEFRLAPAAAESLCRRYAALAGDPQIARRLPFHRLAWLAFRLGYAQLAVETVDAREAERFRRRATFYAGRLRREIARLETGGIRRLALSGWRGR